jgi:hypothetical protein
MFPTSKEGNNKPYNIQFYLKGLFKLNLNHANSENKPYRKPKPVLMA